MNPRKSRRKRMRRKFRMKSPGTTCTDRRSRVYSNKGRCVLLASFKKKSRVYKRKIASIRKQYKSATRKYKQQISEKRKRAREKLLKRKNARRR